MKIPFADKFSTYQVKRGGGAPTKKFIMKEEEEGSQDSSVAIHRRETLPEPPSFGTLLFSFVQLSGDLEN